MGQIFGMKHYGRKPIYKRIWVYPLILAILAGAGWMIVQRTKPVSVQGLYFEKIADIMDINDVQDVVLVVCPKQSDLSDISVHSSDEKILTIEMKDAENGEIRCVVNSFDEGRAVIYAENEDGNVCTKKSTIIVEDRAKIEEWKQEAKERELLAAQQKDAEEQGDSSTEQTNTENNEKTVYYTATGSKYHYKNPCGKGTYYPCTLAEAKERGLGPCGRCVKQ